MAVTHLAGASHPSRLMLAALVGAVATSALAFAVLTFAVPWSAQGGRAQATDTDLPDAPLPASRVDLVDAARAGHDGAIARLSRDGLVLARGHADGALQVVDLAEGSERLLAGGGSAVADLVLSADGQALAARTSDGALTLWRRGDDEPLVLRARSGKAGCDACGAALAFAPDGAVLLAADGGGGLVLHDPETGVKLDTWRVGRAAVDQAAFSADGRVIVTGDRSGGLRFWTNTGDALWSASTSGSKPGRLALSPDGQWLAVGAPTGVNVFDARTGRMRHRLESSAGTPADLAFSANSGMLGMLAVDGAVELWDATTGLARRSQAAEELPLRIARYMASEAPVVLGRGDWTYRVWTDVSRLGESR